MTEQLHFHFSLSCVGEGNGNPLQCSCLENSRDGESGGLPSMGSHRVGHEWSDLAIAAAVAAKIPWKREWLPTPYFLAWRIPQTEESGGLQFIGSQRVRHDWSDLACTCPHPNGKRQKQRDNLVIQAGVMFNGKNTEKDRGNRTEKRSKDKKWGSIHAVTREGAQWLGTKSRSW